MGGMGAQSLLKILLVIFALRGTYCGQECDPNGVSCINCTGYQECSEGAPKGPILSCKNGAKCDNQPLMDHCWIKLNCYALNECTEVGIFPDVMIESNYFVCLPDSGSGFLKYDFTCPEGEFFDRTARICVASAVTSETTLPPTLETTTAVPTPSPTPETTTITPTSVTTTSTPTPAPTTTPATTTLASTPKTTTTTLTTTSIPTPAPTTTTTTVPAPTPTTPPSPFACTAPGIFPNPTNCKMYFRCSTSLKVFYYICPGTSYFNENTLKCSLIITPACREQILQNTTTSATPMTTASTPTTTPVPTPVITTTTAREPSVTTTIQPSTTTTTQGPTTTLPSTQQSTTTTTQAPSTPFSCSAVGTFENFFDCKTYYRCTPSGKTFLYVCPNGSYYNEFTKRCGLIITPRCRSKLEG